MSASTASNLKKMISVDFKTLIPPGSLVIAEEAHRISVNKQKTDNDEHREYYLKHTLHLLVLVLLPANSNSIVTF